MNNKLFIVCPFSSLESFIRSRFGDDVLFLTYSGAVLQYHDTTYLEVVKGIIAAENIGTVYFVNEVSCRFLNGVIKGDPPTGLYAEYIIRDLFSRHYRESFRGQPLFRQQVKLAELNIKAQMDQIINSSMIGNPGTADKIRVKGAIVSKERDMLVEINSRRRFQSV